MQKFLIAGLGNIGDEYQNTRHNIGFLIAEKVAEKLSASFKSANFGQLCDTSYKGRKVFILKPDTYMNLSGNAVNFWKKKENIPTENILIICDDLSLSFGTLRLKTKGSAAGHNGLKNIETILQTNQYSRLRFGIGNEFSKGHQIDFVIGNWNEEETEKLPEKINFFAEAVLSFVFAGSANTMNSFNGK